MGRGREKVDRGGVRCAWRIGQGSERKKREVRMSVRMSVVIETER